MSSNIARLLESHARAHPDRDAIVAARRDGGFDRVSFAALHQRSSALAAGFQRIGIGPGVRTLLMVRAGIELITCTWALFKAGAVPVMIDPGMGRRALLRCVEQTRPQAMVGIPAAHFAKALFRSSFASVRSAVTVGRRWFWPGPTMESLSASTTEFECRDVAPDETAAILFTSGSTGPAKGVVYSHGIFHAQIHMLRSMYGFGPDDVDVAAFPLFSLFDSALGMTSVIPRVDPSRPGQCDPADVVHAIQATNATTSFGSPAIWTRVAPWCLARGVTLPCLRRVISAGASVPITLVEQLHKVVGGDVFTPYGATECLPVTTISGRELVSLRQGDGTCVGRPVAGLDVRVMRISDDPIARWSDALEVPRGEVGELCVKGPVVTHRYDAQPAATALAKMIDEDGAVWHRMGDLGRIDDDGCIWFCGRKSERVRTPQQTLFTDCVERVAASHPARPRTALVGVGSPGAHRPVIVVEGARNASLAEELRALCGIRDVLFHKRFPVDVRHNAKIDRPALARWAAGRL